jgi:hypothetical protein
MADDSDWVADVRRWVQSQPVPPRGALAVTPDALDELGYEAAHPSLQDTDWKAPAPTSFTDLR